MKKKLTEHFIRWSLVYGAVAFLFDAVSIVSIENIKSFLLTVTKSEYLTLLLLFVYITVFLLNLVVVAYGIIISIKAFSKPKKSSVKCVKNDSLI